ncbi:MAG TPA: cyclase family protein [Solirubrobacteraceae bacterium]|nr:cyclase family protein [Solirubrobacteraceae bacterium]
MTTIDADAAKTFESVKNWGRWGEDDQLGTLNYLSGEATKQAARLVTSGDIVSCSRKLSVKPGPGNAHPLLHHMTASGESAPDTGFGVAADWVGLGFHGPSVTHIDSLSHAFWDGIGYNGFRASDVKSSGAGWGSVELAGRGIVSRGVLLDLAEVHGGSWLAAGTSVDADDLLQAERCQGVTFGTGDVLYIRTGRDVRTRREGPFDPGHDGVGGLHYSCMELLHERQIAALGSDAAHDVLPSGVEGFDLPVHTIALVSMGLWLIDNAYLEPLTARCRELGRWEFLAAVSPLLIPRSTGSPANPLAIL